MEMLLQVNIFVSKNDITVDVGLLYPPYLYLFKKIFRMKKFLCTREHVQEIICNDENSRLIELGFLPEIGRKSRVLDSSRLWGALEYLFAYLHRHYYWNFATLFPDIWVFFHPFIIVFGVSWMRPLLRFRLIHYFETPFKFREFSLVTNRLSKSINFWNCLSWFTTASDDNGGYWSKFHETKLQTPLPVSRYP